MQNPTECVWSVGYYCVTGILKVDIQEVFHRKSHVFKFFAWNFRDFASIWATIRTLKDFSIWFFHFPVDDVPTVRSICERIKKICGFCRLLSILIRNLLDFKLSASISLDFDASFYACVPLCARCLVRVPQKSWFCQKTTTSTTKTSFISARRPASGPADQNATLCVHGRSYLEIW